MRGEHPANGMNCPSCSAAMATLTVDGHLGLQVEIDQCPACQVFWFDHHESLRLSPRATLQLFRGMGEQGRMSPAPVREPLKCPRCKAHLKLTHDRQHNTTFRYWKCGHEHGRLITFFDFLREKDFIRALTKEQLVELRQNAPMINCSNCGAPIDLGKWSACEHCKTPISMIDVKQIERMAEQLQRAGEPRPVDPMLPERLDSERRQVERLFSTLRSESNWEVSSSFGLVEVGLRMVAKLIK